ncbi:MAG: aminotransferase class V-fold PLP-dependent enzyme [Clostridia bacterium]|nr:aminotransferase class V-fold PLP-dependent enzyme [Clostridia bacterium]
MIYLDNAATTYPKPLNVIKASFDANKSSANPGRSGYKSAMLASEKMFECRQKAADFFGLENVENCILTPSCTIALNTVIHGTLSRGDHVVISSLEHNSVLRPLQKLASKGIIAYEVAEGFEGDADITVESFRKCMNDKTKLVVCTHASNVFGIKLPVKRIAALCKYYGVLFCIDVAQSAGVVPIDIKDIGADFICAPGHKGLYGPMGTGLLLINTDKIPESLFEGGTGSSDLDLSFPDILPDKYESGTMNYSGFSGLSKGIDFVNLKTIERISNHEIKLIRKIYSKLKQMKNIKLYTIMPDIENFVPLMSFNVKGNDPVKVAETLDKQYGVCVRAGFHCSPLAHKYMKTGDSGTVRICPSAFTLEKEADFFINAVYNISKK